MSKLLLKQISKGFLVAILVVGAFFTVKIFNFSTNHEEELSVKEFTKRYSIYAVELPKELSFSGEKVPLENFDVRESLDREIQVNTYWQSQTILLIKRISRYFKVIEPILKKNKIPDDFKYLAVAESGLQNVVSPSGARGYWQFMNNTAKEYNLEVNGEVDERYCIEKSTQAACDYLNESYAKYKNWTLVAASYNMGKAGLNKQMQRQQANNYYDLLLNTETSRYVFRILALKLILSNPEKYGFHILEKDKYLPFEYDIITADTTIADFSHFADSLGTNYKMLKYFNPWLRDNSLTIKNKEYLIKIPKKDYRIKRYVSKDDNIDSLSN